MNNKFITQITENIYRFNNQYFYGEKVGTYLIDLPDKVILFDIPTYSKEVEEYLKNFNKPIEILLSHGSCGISDGTKYQKNLNATVYLHEADKDSYWLRMKPDVLFESPFLLDDSLEIILTPGHSKGSICLYDKISKSLFVGDTLGGLVNGEVRDFVKEDSRNDDIHQRLKSCQNLLNYDFERILPFHYEMILNNVQGSLREFIQKYS